MTKTRGKERSRAWKARIDDALHQHTPYPALNMSCIIVIGVGRFTPPHPRRPVWYRRDLRIHHCHLESCPISLDTPNISEAHLM